MKPAYVVLALVLAVIPFASGKSVEYANCSDTSDYTADLHEVDLTPCEKEPCPVKKGNKVTVELTFVPKEELTSLWLSVRALIKGFPPLPIPVPSHDGCDTEKFQLKCPLEKGVETTMVIEENAPGLVPSGTYLTLEAKLRDQTKATAICGRVKVVVA